MAVNGNTGRFLSTLAIFIAIVLCNICTVRCLDNGLALTPPSKLIFHGLIICQLDRHMTSVTLCRALWRSFYCLFCFYFFHFCFIIHIPAIHKCMHMLVCKFFWCSQQKPHYHRKPKQRLSILTFLISILLIHFIIVGWMQWERFRCNIDCVKDPDNCIRYILVISNDRSLSVF